MSGTTEKNDHDDGLLRKLYETNNPPRPVVVVDGVVRGSVAGNQHNLVDRYR